MTSRVKCLQLKVGLAYCAAFVLKNGAHNCPPQLNCSEQQRNVVLCPSFLFFAAPNLFNRVLNKHLKKICFLSIRIARNWQHKLPLGSEAGRNLVTYRKRIGENAVQIIAVLRGLQASSAPCLHLSSQPARLWPG